jgi:integrase/recombinase XerC
MNVDAFKSYLRQKDASDDTINAYLNDVKKFSRWYSATIGTDDVSLAGIGALDIAEFKRYLQNVGQKPATINRALASLAKLFAWAVETGQVASNPASGIKPVQEVRSAPKALGRLEQLALMRAVQARKKPRDVAIVTLLIHAGLRVSECCGLDMADVVIRDRSGVARVLGKGNKYRDVPINATARSALRDWLDIRGDAPGPLFTSQKKGRISTRAVEHMVENYSRIAKLEGVTPHSLRHCFCKSLIDSGESIDRVAMLAGHENLNTTARYTRATAEDLQKTVERLAWE